MLTFILLFTILFVVFCILVKCASWIARQLWRFTVWAAPKAIAAAISAYILWVIIF